MEINEILKKAAEESLTIDDCQFFLSRTGQKSSQTLFKNYLRKYHPKNGSLSHYYDLKAKKVGADIKYESKLLGRKKRTGKNCSASILSELKGERGEGARGECSRIIEMTEKEGVVRKGLWLPLLKVR